MHGLQATNTISSGFTQQLSNVYKGFMRSVRIGSQNVGWKWSWIGWGFLLMQTLPLVLSSPFFEVSDGSSYRKWWCSKVSFPTWEWIVVVEWVTGSFIVTIYAWDLFVTYFSSISANLGENTILIKFSLLRRRIFDHVSFCWTQSCKTVFL